jgi:ubiquinone/menaquinone biosynthesis C-methylase UbiE
MVQRTEDMTTLDRQFKTKQIMSGHFSYVARYYRHLRTTDLAPIRFIKENIIGCEPILAADIGCGAGRYSYNLLWHLPIRQLICIDVSEQMLRANCEYLRSKKVYNYSFMRSSAERIPLANSTLDCVFTFNAIHHFNIVVFLNEAARIMKKGGKTFVYTRLRSQNATNIWGMYFPSFLDKEKRLYELEELDSAIEGITGLVFDSVNEFNVKRKTSLKELVMRARLKHYSTFSLYEKDEFEQALRVFENTVSTEFGNLNDVTWHDEYAMLVIRKTT